MRGAVFFLLATLGSSGCAFINQSVALEPLPGFDPPPPAPARQVVLRELVDGRVETHRVGVVKNGWGHETASVVTDTPVAPALTQALAQALQQAGWTVRRAPAGEWVPAPTGEDWVVSGWVRSVMSEPLIGFWAIDLLAEAELTLEVRTARRLYRRTFRGLEVSTNHLACFSGCAEEGLQAAMALAVRDAVFALAELSARVPPFVLDPAPMLLKLDLEVTP